MSIVDFKLTTFFTTIYKVNYIFDLILWCKESSYFESPQEENFILIVTSLVF